LNVNCCYANQSKFWVIDPDGVDGSYITSIIIWLRSTEVELNNQWQADEIKRRRRN